MHSLRLKNPLNGLANGFTGGFNGHAAGESNEKRVIKAGGDDTNRNKSQSAWADWLRLFFRSKPFSQEVE